jgi:glutaredoxin
MSIIVGLENCSDCKRYKNLHPEHKYVSLDMNSNLSKEERINLKKVLEKLNWDKKVPVLLNDNMTQIIHRSKLIQELKLKNNKTTSCKNCGC